MADFHGGWTCAVDQGHYGHLARKPTWLYANQCELPALKWGKSSASEIWAAQYQGRSPREKLSRTGALAIMNHKQRSATPLPFRDLLIGIARSEVRVAA
jgi:hypothetical protein